LGKYATAMGYNTFAKSEASTAMGAYTIAEGFIATAMGSNTLAAGHYSTSMGGDTKAIGIGSTAMGEATVAAGNHSTSMGEFTVASGDNTTTMGYGTIASDYGSLVLGQYNSAGATVTSNATSYAVSNTAFVIGNGTAGDSKARSDAFKVLFNGNTTMAGTLTIGAITLPNIDGNANEVLTTDGAGVLAWSVPASVSIADNSVTTAKIDNGTIDEIDLDTSVNKSLELANSALQSFDEVDGSRTNEIQSLSIEGSALTLSDSNTITIPSGTDDQTATEVSITDSASLITATTVEGALVENRTAIDAKAPIANPTFTGTVGGITKAMVALGSVDNTTDADKPISTATQAALDAKATAGLARFPTNTIVGYPDGDGFRRADATTANYGNLGAYAIDLSISDGATDNNGATGFAAMATGYNSLAAGAMATAMGKSTTASGDGATAMGSSTKATAKNAIAMGETTEATAQNATAMGNSTKAIATGATAMGNTTLASGSNSTAMGYETQATGENATAMGYETKATFNSATAMGRKTLANGDNSTAMGRETEASGSNSTAMGESTEATAQNATAMGIGTIASDYGSVVIGQYNSAGATITSSAGSYADDNTAFVIGNGTDDGENKSDAFKVLFNGNTAAAGTVTANAFVGDGSGLTNLPAATNLSGGIGGEIPYQSAAGITTLLANGSAGLVLRSNGTTLAPSWQLPSSDAGLTSITEGTNTGYRRADADSDEYGNIGSKAVDLSTSYTNSSILGATGMFSFAAGYETRASGLFSTTLGTGTEAIGGSSTAMGNSTKAIETNSTAMGHATLASGVNSTAMGYVTEASGVNSTAMGNDTKASGYNATAMGFGTTASDYGSVVIGQYNSAGATITSSAGSYAADNTAFVIGNGTDDGENKSDAFKVLFNGNTTAAGTVTANAFVGDGSGLTNLPASYEGLQSVTENSKTGYRRADANADNYGDIGQGAIDLSISEAPSSTFGATGSAAIAMGSNIKASEMGAIAIGSSLIANTVSEMVIGRFNEPSEESNSTWTEDDPLFTIGNGSELDEEESSGRNNAFQVLKNGDTYIDGNVNIGGTKITKYGVTAASFHGDGSSLTDITVEDNAITSAKIENGTIVGEDIADDAITSAKIENGTIVGEDIADDAITSAKIKNGTIVGEDIADDAAIAQSKIAGLTDALASAGGGFTTTTTIDGVTSNVNNTWATDDFVFGSSQLSDIANNSDDDSRFLFDKGRGAFRAGTNTTNSWDNSRSGNNSVAMGYNTTAGGEGAVAIGTASDKHGGGTETLGPDASGKGAIAMGLSTIASGNGAYAFGSESEASGLNSMAGGFLSKSTGANSVAIGTYITANTIGEVALGRYNTPASANNNWNGLDPLFTIGNGSSSESTKNAFQILKNGDTTIDGKLTVGAITLPSIDGDAKDVLTTDGAGVLGWSAPGSAATEVSITDSDSLITATNVEDALVENRTDIDANENAIAAIKPAISGTAGQVLTMNADATPIPVWEKPAASGGLLSITEGVDSNMGYRRADANAANYGDIGQGAIDLSISDSPSSIFGATGIAAIAMGRNTTATGIYSTAMGWDTKASGFYSTAMGYRTEAIGISSTAMGSQTAAKGQSSAAMGFRTKAIGNNATAMGSFTEAIGENATAMGTNTITSDYGSVVIGQYNLAGAIATSSATSYAAENTAFVIGNGTGPGSESDAFKVFFNGNTTAAGTVTANAFVGDGSGLTNLPSSYEGLQSVTENSKTGYRRADAVAANYGDIGQDAIDLSISDSPSSIYGATGNISLAMGRNTTATGVYSTAMGNGTKASGDNSTAMGDRTEAIGIASAAMGSETEASGNVSIAMGFKTEASGERATAMGTRTIASDYGSVVIGQYNLAGATATSSATSYAVDNTAFVIGNGTDDDENKSDAFKVLFNGNTTAAGTVTANAFVGDGSGLTNVTASAIADGDITSAKISNATILNEDISSSAAIDLSKISGLTDALSSLTSGLTDASTSLTDALNSKQSIITDDGLTIAKTSGLQDALDAKASIDNPIFTGQTVTVNNDIKATRYVLTAPDAITASSTTTIDLSTGNVITISLSAATTLTTSNADVGTYLVKLVQNSSGNHTVSFPAAWKWSGGSAPTVTPTAYKTDIVTLIYDGSTFYAAISQNF
jgi:hypothetical protein